LAQDPWFASSLALTGVASLEHFMTLRSLHSVMQLNARSLHQASLL
jgi:hypothetical protein